MIPAVRRPYSAGSAPVTRLIEAMKRGSNDWPKTLIPSGRITPFEVCGNSARFFPGSDFRDVPGDNRSAVRRRIGEFVFPKVDAVDVVKPDKKSTMVGVITRLRVGAFHGKLSRHDHACSSSERR